MHIKTHTATYPHVRIEEGKALVLIESRVDALVQVEYFPTSFINIKKLFLYYIFIVRVVQERLFEVF